jgi:hypothetical protein
MCCTEITDVLQFTTDVWKSHRQRQCTVQLVCEDRVLFVIDDFHVALCEKQHPKSVRVIHLVYPPFFSNAALSPKTKI